ncbi:MAG TPA: hypothetical protein VMU85_02995 [Stellaceae bacterium]|nr:hypothetical protein [Stellaceae bacterium]
MRGIVIALFLALLCGLGAAGGAQAAPAAAAGLVNPSVGAQPLLQEARYVRRCRTVHVWRNTRHGRRLVPVKRCRRVWVR